MAIVDIIIPTYRDVSKVFQKNLIETINRVQCRCGTHVPWQCDRGKHSLYMQPHVDSCVIHWSRNTLVSSFLHAPTIEGRPPADYCLMLDDDILLEQGSLERLLSHRKDVVVGICTKRADPPEPTIRQWNAETGRFDAIVEWDWRSQKLMEVDGAGAACMLIKRGVLEKMAEAYLDCLFERHANAQLLAKIGASIAVLEDADKYWDAQSAKRRQRYAEALANENWQAATCWWFQFLWDQEGNERGEMAEDLTFCWKIKRLGYRIFADPQVLPGHLGLYAYNVRDFIWVRESEKASMLPRPNESDGTNPQLTPIN